MNAENSKWLSDIAAKHDDFDVGEWVGQGSFGDVYKAYDQRKDPPELVGYKIAKNPVSDDLSKQKMLMRELEILATMKHPATLRLAGLILPTTEHPRLIIVTPFFKNGSLEEALKTDLRKRPKQGWTPTAKSKCMFGVAAGMNYLHSRDEPICHRDLKAENVLLNDNWEPCIADFGLSRFVPNDGGGVMQSDVGTPLYKAPEVMAVALNSDSYTLMVDVYAFAIMLYQFFTVKITQFDDGLQIGSWWQLCNGIMNGKRFARLPTIPDYTWDLIMRCWDGVPLNRPSFAEIVDELKMEPEKWAFPGTDMSELREYMDRVTQPLEGEVVDIDAIITRSSDFRSGSRSSMTRSSGGRKKKYEW